jgi:hypothetical protein
MKGFGPKIEFAEAADQGAPNRTLMSQVVATSIETTFFSTTI